MPGQRMPKNFQRLIAFFKKREGYEDFTPPDPTVEFPHPENASLFTCLEENARSGIPGVMGGYRTTAHTDLTSILYDLITDRAVRKGYVFGKPVMATPTGLVFAYGGGTR